MSLREYRNKKTGKSFYVFAGEEHKVPGNIKDYRLMPPNPSTVIATHVYMTEMPQLDSLKTIYELDRILNIEAEQEREDKAYQELTKEL